MPRAIFHPDDEQALVQAFFGPSPGVFVDVGAHDPVVNSQSYHLERLGWTGVLVEPIPEFASRLRAQRSAAVVEVACGATEGAARFNVAGVYSSVLPVKEGVVTRVIEVRVRQLDSVVHEAGLSHVDFLSLDVEGLELQVLAGFSLEIWRPRLVLIEDHVDDLSRHRHLRARGYKLMRRTGVNAWYVPRELPFRLGLQGHWQLLRKYVLGLPVRKMRNTLRRLRT